MTSTDVSAPRIFKQEVFSVTMTSLAESRTPVLLNLCTKREYAKAFIADAFPDFKPMPSFRANTSGELGTVYYHQGMEIRIQTIPVGFGIYQWLIGAEHYRSPIAEAMA